MRVLVTGDRGLVGRAVTAAVRARGWTPVGFDIADDLDVRDPDALRHAAAGCQAIAHLAARLGRPEEAAVYLAQLHRCDPSQSSVTWTGSGSGVDVLVLGWPREWE